MRNRMHLVQVAAAGRTVTILVNPTDAVRSARAPFFARMEERYGKLATQLLSRTSTPLEQTLADAGACAPEAIDYVTFDHLHVQDVRGLLAPERRWARVPAEREAARPAGRARHAGRLHPLQVEWYIPDCLAGVPADRIVALDGDYAIGGGFALVRTPGHTAGNHSLVVVTDRGAWTISENGICVDAYAPGVEPDPRPRAARARHRRRGDPEREHARGLARSVHVDGAREDARRSGAGPARAAAALRVVGAGRRTRSRRACRRRTRTARSRTASSMPAPRVRARVPEAPGGARWTRPDWQHLDAEVARGAKLATPAPPPCSRSAELAWPTGCSCSRHVGDPVPAPGDDLARCRGDHPRGRQGAEPAPARSGRVPRDAGPRGEAPDRVRGAARRRSLGRRVAGLGAVPATRTGARYQCTIDKVAAGLRVVVRPGKPAAQGASPAAAVAGPSGAPGSAATTPSADTRPRAWWAKPASSPAASAPPPAHAPEPAPAPPHPIVPGGDAFPSAAVSANAAAALARDGLARLAHLLEAPVAIARERGASDVFLSTGRSPRLRLDGRVESIDLPTDDAELAACVAAIGTNTDHSLELDGTRLRVNVFDHLNGVRRRGAADPRPRAVPRRARAPRRSWRPSSITATASSSCAARPAPASRPRSPR